MDVTPLLRKGKNTIRVQLSRGWWAGGISRKVYADNPPLALMARLTVDGQCIAQTADPLTIPPCSISLASHGCVPRCIPHKATSPLPGD
ncbi:MAG: alpha-L-rhamnosidase N-terminal domain-containing protein [Prevotella sp.]|nr:alpha-L-rhamnosidase N-terminal domain-containing protein [Prevotella sp.]